MHLFTRRQTWLFSSTSTYHSTDFLTARGVAHLVVHGTSGSTSYETIPPVRLETTVGVLSLWTWWCNDVTAMMMIIIIYTDTWPCGVMVSALDLRLKCRWFDSRPFRFQVTTLGKLFTHMRLCHQPV